MIEGTSVNIECKLLKVITLGDHTTFVGEVVEASDNPEKEPLAYYDGKYFIMNTKVVKPSDVQRETIRRTIEKYKR